MLRSRCWMLKSRCWMLVEDALSRSHYRRQRLNVGPAVLPASPLKNCHTAANLRQRTLAPLGSTFSPKHDRIARPEQRALSRWNISSTYLFSAGMEHAMHCFCNRTNNLCGGHSLAFRSKILLQRRYLAGLEQYILLRNSLFAFSTKHAASFFLDNFQQWRLI